MNALKWRRRRAFVLRLQGLTYTEVGERLGVSESTALGDVVWIEARQRYLRSLQPNWLQPDGP